MISAVAPEECVEAFRAVHVADLNHPELQLDFRSHYEEGLRPRYQQTQHSALHYAVSFWRSEQVAREVAQRFSKHGNHIARVLLTFGHGFDCLDQSAERDPQHLTVWGDNERLARAVVDIVPV